MRCDPAISVEIKFPIGAFCRRPESAQIVGCLFQHTDRQTFFRRRQCRFGWRNREMGAASIAGFCIQKCGELLTRQSRQWVAFQVLIIETGRKHKLIGEIAGLSNAVGCYQIHHIDR